ncbi:MAG: sigma 54-interacting transcriptional regulator [Myxococcaceae bacterium]|nr:sigma 54-interacting transcriptional regulator [Myxococcaceae bacterium]
MASKDVTHSITASIGSDKSPLQPVRLLALDGPGKGARTELKVGTATAGSDSRCDLVLEDDTVSRRHALFELLPGSVKVVDLESRNGTKYLGAKVKEALVPIGGTVQLGKTMVSIQPLDTQPVAEAPAELGSLVGHSPAMRKLFTALEKAARQDVTLLLRGETGVGKTAVARTVHGLSKRAARPFVVFDCASAAPTLIESALFGHRRGAFTGADADRIGAVAAAEGGTLFLDEVAELPATAQPRLLRLLEAREYLPVGDVSPRKADVRVIAATHRDLESDRQRSRFREDLYFRLAVAELWIPPLRERREDIPVLAARFAKERAQLDVGLDQATIAAFTCSDWPGNVRELRNAVERVVVLGDTPSAAAESAVAPSFASARDEALSRFEKDFLTALLKQHGGNASQAARAAGLARSHFYRLLTRHGLSRRDE